MLSADLNKEVIMWRKKYKALVALNSFLLIAISFNTETSFTERASQSIGDQTGLRLSCTLRNIYLSGLLLFFILKYSQQHIAIARHDLFCFCCR